MTKLFLAAAFLVPAAAFANGYHLPITNPRDMAFGGSGTAAIQNSASAVYANPAALAGLDGLNLSGSLELITLSATWKDPSGVNPGEVSSVPKAAFPPAAYISYGDNLGGLPVALGAGFTVAGGGTLLLADQLAGTRRRWSRSIARRSRSTWPAPSSRSRC